MSATGRRWRAMGPQWPLPETVARVLVGRAPAERLALGRRSALAWAVARQHRAMRWVATASGRREAPLERLRLFGVIVAWMEADVIAATVRNLLAQGCERVYLLDNDSPDDTVARAVEAGAEVAGRFRSRGHDEQLARLEANHLAARVSRQVWREEGSTPVWWLHADADELPRGPGGLTVREHLSRLGADVRVVGTTGFDHWPTGSAPTVGDAWPEPAGSLCTPRWSLACHELHWKHQLVRLDPDRPLVLVGAGLHRAVCDEPTLLEAPLPLVVHHRPFRDEQATRARLAALSERGADGANRLSFNRFEMGHRASLLDAVYAGRWDEIPSPNPLARGRTIRPAPVERVVPPELRG